MERLLRFDKDFSGALYPLKSIDWDLIPQRCVNGGESVRQAALSYVGTFCDPAERKQEKDFATAIYAGGGFQLIRRAALERMVAAYPETHFSRVHGLADVRLATRRGTEFELVCALRLHDRSGDGHLSERGLFILPTLAQNRRRNLA